MTVRKWNEGDDVVALTELLHRAYAGLAEQGMRFTATYQDSETTLRRISYGTCLVAEVEGEIIGTATVWQTTPDNTSDPDYYHQPGVSVLSQFGIEPAWQGKGIGKQLFEACEDEARERGCDHIALDTSERAVHLIAMYTHWGFEHVCDHQWPAGVNYRSVIMTKPL